MSPSFERVPNSRPFVRNTHRLESRSPDSVLLHAETQRAGISVNGQSMLADQASTSIPFVKGQNFGVPSNAPLANIDSFFQAQIFMRNTLTNATRSVFSKPVNILAPQ